MSVSDQDRDNSYTASSPVQKYLYSSSESGSQLLALAGKYDLRDRDIYKKFAIAVGDIVLGFYRTEDTANLMQQELGLSPQMSASLANDVKVFLQPLNDPNWKIPTEDDAKAGVAGGDINQDILEAEALLNAIPNPIPQPPEAVYTSTQSAILSEARIVPTPPPAPAPTAVPLPPPASVASSAPRWDTQ